MAEVAKILRPSIMEVIRLDPSRVVACVAIPDPALQYTPQYLPTARPRPLFWEGVFGETDRTKWKNPYDEFARAKAVLSWRTGLPSHLIQRNRPHLFENGDIKFGGSTAYEGIVVGTSGLAWHHDLIISGMFATALHALAIGAFEFELELKPYFIGQS